MVHDYTGYVVLCVWCVAVRRFIFTSIATENNRMSQKTSSLLTIYPPTSMSREEESTCVSVCVCVLVCDTEKEKESDKGSY